MLQKMLSKYSRSKTKFLCRALMANGVKRAVFATAYGEVAVPVNSRSIIKSFLRGEYYGEAVAKQFLGLHSKSSTLLNIGANVGTTARIFVDSEKYEVVKCFEPEPENFLGLKSNLCNAENVLLFNVALGKGRDSLLLNLSPESVGRHSFKTDFRKGAVEVRVETIDEHLGAGEKFDVFMDVEGWEIEVLKGGKKSLKNCNVCALEWNQQLHQPGEISEMAEIMTSVGFDAFIDLRNRKRWHDMSKLPELTGQRDIAFVRGF